MGYSFVGFFTNYRSVKDSAQRTWPGADVVSVNDPFTGIGIRLGEALDSSEDYRHHMTQASAEHAEATLVFIEAQCFGGRCEYSGGVFEAGRLIAVEQGDGALARLARHLAVELDAREHFEPFTREFDWNSG